MDGDKKVALKLSEAIDKNSLYKSSDGENISFGVNDDQNDQDKLSDKEAHRMHRHHKKLFIIYPEDSWKSKWDIFISLVLIASCLSTPIELAFFEEPTIGWKYSNFSIDLMFFIDIIIIFNTAYYNQDFILIDERSQIAK